MRWRYDLDIKTALGEAGSKPMEESRKLLADALRVGPKDKTGFVPPGLRQRFARVADHMEKVNTVDEFNGVLDEAYDLADREDVWLGLM